MHYKQMPYTVLMVALREEDNEPCVVYRAEYGSCATFIRTIANFTEQVAAGGKQVLRFAPIND